MKYIVQTILFTKKRTDIVYHKLKSFVGFFIKNMLHNFFFFA